MRSLVIVLLVTLFTIPGFAQDVVSENEKPAMTKRFKPRVGDWGLTFSLNGLVENIRLSSFEDEAGNPMVLGRYYYKEDVALRLGFSLNSSNRKISTVDSVGNSQVTRDSTNRKTDLFVIPGIEFHLEGSEKLDPYIGLSATLGILGKTNINVEEQTIDTTGTADLTIDSRQGGGSALGLNVIAGFNYFFSPRFSIGAEYSFGYNWIRRGGDFTRDVIENPISGSQIIINERGSDVTTEQGLKIRSTAGITLSYFFGRKKRSKPVASIN